MYRQYIWGRVACTAHGAVRRNSVAEAEAATEAAAAAEAAAAGGGGGGEPGSACANCGEPVGPSRWCDACDTCAVCLTRLLRPEHVNSMLMHG